MGQAYMHTLERNILSLPPPFTQVSISGGEPTLLSKEEFRSMLTFLRRKFKKIVLNTNGHRLLSLLRDDYIRENIDHINLSRHSINDDENRAVFGTDTIPDTDEILKINNLKPVRLNCIFRDKIDYQPWISYAHGTHSTGIAFRRLAKLGVKTTSSLERELDADSGVELLFKSKCRVCYGSHYKTNGLSLVVRYSVDEPKDYMKKDTIYEIITDGNGDLNYMWDNTPATKLTNLTFKVRYNPIERALTRAYKAIYKEDI